MDDKVIKIRRSGNSNILTVPKEIQPNSKFYHVFQGRDGMIVYVPITRNPFKDPAFIEKFADSRQAEEAGGQRFDTELS